jgi:hypothetical protein
MASALTGSGQRVYLIPVDHLSWTPALQALADQPGGAKGKRLIWLGGTASPRLGAELKQRGIELKTGGRAKLLAAV